MAVSIKSSAEIELMREAGRILAITHDELAKQVKPGMSTLEVDRIGEEIIIIDFAFCLDDVLESVVHNRGNINIS